MEHTLLIWNESPEEVKLYLIPNEESNKYVRFLDQAQNRMVNGDEMNDGMSFLITALSEEEDCTEEGFEEYLGVLAPFRYMQMSSPITDTTITKVYYAGFYI